MANYPVVDFCEELEKREISYNQKVIPLLISHRILCNHYKPEHFDNVFILKQLSEMFGYDCIDTFAKILCDLNKGYESLKDVHCILYYVNIGRL